MLGGVDRGVSANAVAEEVDAAIVGTDLPIQLAHGEVTIVEPNGGEEGVVDVIEAGEEILNKLFLVNCPACINKFVRIALHLGGVLCGRHVLLPRPGEGDA
jgi:hypothetical protein